MSETSAAANKIQERFRAFKAQKAANKKILFDSWAQLDIKEENELRETNAQFDKLKVEFGKRMGNSTLSQQEQKTFEEQMTAKLEKINKERESEVKEGKQSADEEGKFGAPAQIPLLGDNPVTMEWITELIDEFKEGRIMQTANLLTILGRVRLILRALPNVIDIEIAQNSRLTIVGDLHGQFDDLLTILKLNGLPNERNPYIFNGDFVDRGQHSCECALVLFAFKLLFPNSVHLNRGNHEAKDINSRDGFERECIDKYDAETFHLFSEVFAALPLMCIVDKEVMVVHGGLFYDDVKMQQIHDFDRFHVTPPAETLMEDMLWSDPCNEPGRYENSRGCACEFGPDVVDTFFTNNPPINMIIRSHECEDSGYAEWFGGKLYTVFSCSNYTGVVGNEGAICILEKDHSPRFVTYMAQRGVKQTRLTQRHGLIEEDIVTKLLVRICANRLGLINHFISIDEKKTGVITRAQWSEGLQTVLGLKIPFLRFQTFLGLPELGVHGRRNGPIDYMWFCNNYQVHNKSGSASAQQAASSSEFFSEMMSVLFARRYELESLFRFFDTDGNGSISRQEFKNGLESLATVLGKSFTDEQVTEIVDMVDTDHSGDIDYSEFFNTFHTKKQDLLTNLKFKQQATKRQTHKVEDLPDFHEVKVIDTGTDRAAVSKGESLGRGRGGKKAAATRKKSNSPQKEKESEKTSSS